MCDAPDVCRYWPLRNSQCGLHAAIAWALLVRMLFAAVTVTLQSLLLSALQSLTIQSLLRAFALPVLFAAAAHVQLPHICTCACA